MTTSPPGVSRAEAHTDGKAKASLILGILALPLSVVAGIPAIILGHQSRSRIKKSGGELKGKGMALAGLIFGYLSVAVLPLILIVAIPYYIIVLKPANTTHPPVQASSSNPVEEIIHAEKTYHDSYPEQGYAPALSSMGFGPAGHTAMPSPAFAGLLDDSLGNADCNGQNWCTKDDYRYIVQSDASEPHKEYTVTATPLQSGKSYCATEDGVLRYDLTAAPLKKPYTHKQCMDLPPL